MLNVHERCQSRFGVEFLEYRVDAFHFSCQLIGSEMCCSERTYISIIPGDHNLPLDLRRRPVVRILHLIHARTFVKLLNL